MIYEEARALSRFRCSFLLLQHLSPDHYETDWLSAWREKMETSLRFSGDSKALRIHAKEKFLVDSKTFLQVHGELDTKFGAPSYFSAVLRHFYPEISASLGLGLQYNKNDKLRYSVRGKAAVPMSSNGLLNIIIKGRCDVDNEFKERKSRGAAELSWSILNFLKDQDMRFKLGYEIFDKVPYIQVRENNWTFNADMMGRWNIRYDL